MITLSYNKALGIQWKQISFYRNSLTREGVKELRSMTLPCPPDLHPDKEISVIEINRLIPRGGSIESIICRQKAGKSATSTPCISGKVTASHMFIFRCPGTSH